jgi:hypothetical protein
MSLALDEPRLGTLLRLERLPPPRRGVATRPPWCIEEWWDAANLTPVGHRAVRDADMAKLGNYLTSTPLRAWPRPDAGCNAIHAEAEDHLSTR